MSRGTIENLIPINKRTKEEQRKISSKGGKASVKARKRKAALRESMDVLLTLEVQNPDVKQKLKEMGLQPDNESLLAFTLFQQSINGNQKATEIIIKTLATKDQLDIEQQTEVIKMLKYKNKSKETDLDGSREKIIIVDGWRD